MHIPTYLLALQVHGPCFTTPKIYLKMKVENMLELKFEICSKTLVRNMLENISSNVKSKIFRWLNLTSSAFLHSSDVSPHHWTYIKIAGEIFLKRVRRKKYDGAHSGEKYKKEEQLLQKYQCLQCQPCV